MTKQSVLRTIDKQIADVKEASNGKVRYSKKEVANQLQDIRQMVSDINSVGFSCKTSTPMINDENDIMNAVCFVTGLNKDDILAPCRNADLIRARKIYSVCMNQMMGYKPDKIGELIGKDRTTVIFHLKNHEADMFSCKQYRNSFNRVCEILGWNQQHN